MSGMDRLQYSADRVQVNTGDITRLILGELFDLESATVRVEGELLNAADGRTVAPAGAEVTITGRLCDLTKFMVGPK